MQEYECQNSLLKSYQIWSRRILLISVTKDWCVSESYLFNQIWSRRKYLTSVPRTDCYPNVISFTKNGLVGSCLLPFWRLFCTEVWCTKIDCRLKDINVLNCDVNHSYKKQHVFSSHSNRNFPLKIWLNVALTDLYLNLFNQIWSRGKFLTSVQRRDWYRKVND